MQIEILLLKSSLKIIDLFKTTMKSTSSDEYHLNATTKDSHLYSHSICAVVVGITSPLHWIDGTRKTNKKTDLAHFVCLLQFEINHISFVVRILHV